MSEFWATLLTKHSATSIADIESQLNVDCVFAPIQNQTVLLISGADSSKFMQGQFTCNLNDITDTRFSHGACCNAKGRMVANFSLAKQGDDYLLAIDESLAETLQTHLKKYMVFFKSTMSQSDYVLAGVTGSSAQKVLNTLFGACPTQDYEQVSIEGGLIIKRPFNAGYELWLTADHAPQYIDALLTKTTLAHSDYWPLNLIRHGLAQLSIENTEAHIPQMLNLGMVEGISFNKGCYTGQEIVARMQYLGKLKRHLYLIQVNGQNIQAGDELRCENANSAIGTIINTINHANSCLALAIIEDKHLKTPIFVGSELGSSVELLSLPYDPQQGSQISDS